MSSKIHILSEQTINQIAAGEVIENPASVVKELVENAIDAGASQITIEIMGGGFQSIIVSDDGCGMEERDALLCLERYATSKIQNAEDLEQLQTMGFRGEALASIAAISKLTLITAVQDHIGIRICTEGGKIAHREPSFRSKGTMIEVRSLFYNVPARKKFQKTAAASSAEITRMTTLLALAHPHVGFELVQQQQTLFSLKAAKNVELVSLVEKRSQDLLGENFQSHRHTVYLKEVDCTLHGVIGSPKNARYNRSGQYLFVNHRPVICPSLAFAIRDGYGTRIDADRHPIYVIHAFLTPSCIDVNVHPQKKEIRIRDEQMIKTQVRLAINLALQQAEMPSAPEVEVPCIPFAPFCNEKDIFSMQTNERLFCAQEERQQELPLKQDIQAIGIFEHYLILEAKSVYSDSDGIIWVDLLAAEERILFERLLRSKETSVPAQGLLLPLTFSCSTAEAQVLSTCLQELHQLGIQMRSIGPAAFIIEAIPLCLEEKQVFAVLFEIVAGFSSECTSSEKKMRKCAEKICRSVRARKERFGLHEGLNVFKELMKTDNPTHCPQGKLTFYPIKKNELENYFTKKR